MPAARSDFITRLVHEPTVSSTMDTAHRLAADGAPAGTVVVADVQTAGRGRGGKVWQSAAGQGLWCTLIERPGTSDGLEVLSLRLGLAVVSTLAPMAHAPLWLKWPNDVFLGPRASAGKLAGLLVEARWRQARVEWVAVGLGINLALPQHDALPPERRAAALPDGIDRMELLHALAPALRAACMATGPLSVAEQAYWAAHDLAEGRPCREPVHGVVHGIQSDGALLVETPAGQVQVHRRGSLELADMV